MKVLQVIPYYFPAQRYGGPIYAVHGLSRKLEQRGVDVTVWTTNIDGQQDLPVRTNQQVMVNGVKVVYFAVGRPRSYIYSRQLAHALKQHVAGFDIVHISGLYVHPTLAAARMCQQQQVSYIISPRGMLDPFAISRKSALKKKLYLRILERKNLEHAAGIHFTATEEQRLAATLGFKLNGFVVPNGVDMAQYVQSDQQHRAQETILFLSRIDPKKGLDLLIPAFARVVKARPRARLIIAGPDTTGYMRVVDDLITQHKLQHNVSYTGMCIGQAKVDAFQSATLFVLPSYSENFGNVVVEAMVCGTPVVITNRVNIWHEVQAQQAGIVTDCTVSSIADGMLAILRNPDLGRRMGQQGKALVQAAFTWDKAAAQMLTVYERLVSQS